MECEPPGKLICSFRHPLSVFQEIVLLGGIIATTVAGIGVMVGYFDAGQALGVAGNRGLDILVGVGNFIAAFALLLILRRGTRVEIRENSIRIKEGLSWVDYRPSEIEVTQGVNSTSLIFSKADRLDHQSPEVLLRRGEEPQFTAVNEWCETNLSK